MWVLWLVTASCRLADQAPGHPIVGTVLQVSEDRVTLDHEPIDGVMPAMVMELLIPQSVALTRGDRIEARLILGDGPTRLEDIEVVGRAELGPPQARWSDSLLIGEVLEPLTVETSAGPVQVGAGQGRVTVLTFLFTRCPVPEFCPLLSTKLAALQHQIGSARIVAVTLDPEHDTPERLAAYGAQNGADPSVWSLGRLPPEKLQALLSRVDVDVSYQGELPTHDLRLLVLDAEGRLVHREQDNAWDIDALAARVRGASRAEGPAEAP